MYWHFDGEIMVHPTDGTAKHFALVSTDFWLPDPNVAVIRAFVADQKELILAQKYHPSSGEAPRGNTYPELMTHLNALQPPDTYLFGVGDKQTQVALIAYRHELINNADSYFHSERQNALVVA